MLESAKKVVKRMLWQLKFYISHIRCVVNQLWGYICQNLGTIIIIIFLGGLIATFVTVMFSDDISYFNRLLEGKDGEKRKILEFIGLGISGAIALYGLVVLNRRAEAQVENNTLTEKGLLQERFKTAVEHLSNDKESLRIASFYELFYLARDNKKDYGQTVADILCAHLRRTAIYEFDFDSSEHSECAVEDLYTEEVVTLFDILFGEENGYVFDQLRHDLRGAKLARFDFKLKGSKRKIDFSKADLSWASFDDGDLGGSIFRNTKIVGVFFSTTKLLAVWFDDMSMEHVSFPEANLKGTLFMNADLCYADLKKAKSLENALIISVKYNNCTKFPEGFNPEDYEGWEYVPPDNNLPMADTVR